MTISLIANVAIYENKLAIGWNNQLLFHLHKDMMFFKNIISTCSSSHMNVVLMGHATYKSILDKNRPLVGRINLVLTNDIEKISTHILAVDINELNDCQPYFINMTVLKRFYTPKMNLFVIGGSTLYNYFLSNNCPIDLKPKRLYISHVLNPGFKEMSCKPNKFMNHFSDYKLLSYSERMKDFALDKKDSTLDRKNKKDFRILTYIRSDEPSHEHKYLGLMQNILDNGIIRQDRTETGTISLFGEKLEFDISKTIPMITTRSVSFKAIIEELLWFARGDTDAKVLQARGVHIWDGNSSRAFLNKQDLPYYQEGVLGPIYGFQWRHFGTQYDARYANVADVPANHEIGGFDQLAYVEHLLRTDPFSRRIMMSSWNPADLNKVALPACHTQVQWYVEETNNIKHLSCMFTMRSNDVALATSYNVCSYAILTYILAMKCNMKPKK